MTRRLGVTLIELVVTTSALSLIAGMAVTLLGTLFVVERSGRDHLTDTTRLGDWLERFRQDAHAAVQAGGERPEAGGRRPEGKDGDGETDSLTLLLDDGTRVEYKIVEERLTRVVTAADGTISHRDDLDLARLGSLSFVTETRNDVPMIVFRLEPRRGRDERQIGRRFEAAALVGRDVGGR